MLSTRPWFGGIAPIVGLAISCVAGAHDTDLTHLSPPEVPPNQRLGVVVPVYRGDLLRAVASLGRWPTNCSPSTLHNTDLVLYYAEGEEDSPTVDAAADTIIATAGACFSTTRVVYAHLEEEVRYHAMRGSSWL